MTASEAILGVPRKPSSKPNQLGYEKLGFVKDGFRDLKDVSPLDLRIGGERSISLHEALRDAGDIITRMPAKYMTYPGGGPVLPVKRIGHVRRPETIHLDEAYLSSFGDLLVPTPSLACSTTLRRLDRARSHC